MSPAKSTPKRRPDEVRRRGPLELVELRAMPSVWAARYRYIRDPLTGRIGPMSFKGREWQRGMVDDLAPRVTGMKAAQMGVTELMIVRAMHSVDVLNRPALYLFPTKEDAGDFSAARWDPMLDMSPELAGIFTDVHNVGLKRAGDTALYFRGSNSRSGIKSIPVAMLCVDEFEEMNGSSVALARERISAQLNPCEWNISTPEYPGTGIHKAFRATDQRRWFVPCPHCGERQTLEFHTTLNGELASPSLVVPDLRRPETAFWQCRACQVPWTEEDRLELIDLGEWRATASSRDHGYHISQLYSPAQTADSLARKWKDAQDSTEDLKEFHNSVLGLPYESAGLKITSQAIDSCQGGYRMFDAFTSGSGVAMGVDIGLKMNYWIGVMSEGRPKLLKAGTVPDFEGLDLLMDLYRVECCVVDAQPERHGASDFRDRHDGQVYLAFYPTAEELQGKETVWNFDTAVVKIHRTALLDRLSTRISRANYSLPADMPREVREHLTNIYRVVEPDAKGNPRAKWDHDGQDHYAHAAVYFDVALEQTVDIGLLDTPSDQANGEWGGTGGFGGAGFGGGGDEFGGIGGVGGIGGGFGGRGGDPDRTFGGGTSELGGGMGDSGPPSMGF